MTTSESDLDQIARKILALFEDNPLWRSSLHMAVEQIRQVWNARGAADREAVSQESERIAIKELDR